MDECKPLVRPRRGRLPYPDAAVGGSLAAGPHAFPFQLDMSALNVKNRSGSDQGLTLVHFSAQRKHFLWDTLGTFS